MAVRREKRRNGFTQIPNETLRDFSMGLSAHAVLMYMLSMNDDWIFVNGVIAKAFGKKERWVQEQMTKLERTGYMTRKPVRDKTGHFIEWDRVVHEMPQNDIPPGAEKQHVVNADT